MKFEHSLYGSGRIVEIHAQRIVPILGQFARHIDNLDNLNPHTLGCLQKSAAAIAASCGEQQDTVIQSLAPLEMIKTRALPYDLLEKGNVHNRKQY